MTGKVGCQNWHSECVFRRRRRTRLTTIWTRPIGGFRFLCSICKANYDIVQGAFCNMILGVCINEIESRFDLKIEDASGGEWNLQFRSCAAGRSWCKLNGFLVYVWVLYRVSRNFTPVYFSPNNLAPTSSPPLQLRPQFGTKEANKWLQNQVNLKP